MLHNKKTASNTPYRFLNSTSLRDNLLYVFDFIFQDNSASAMFILQVEVSKSLIGLFAVSTSGTMSRPLLPSRQKNQH